MVINLPKLVILFTSSKHRLSNSGYNRFKKYSRIFGKKNTQNSNDNSKPQIEQFNSSRSNLEKGKSKNNQVLKMNPLVMFQDFASKGFRHTVFDSNGDAGFNEVTGDADWVRTLLRPDLVDLLNLVPDTVLDKGLRDALQDLSKFIDMRVLSHVNDMLSHNHPLPVNATLLILYAVKCAAVRGAVVNIPDYKKHFQRDSSVERFTPSKFREQLGVPVMERFLPTDVFMADVLRSFFFAEEVYKQNVPPTVMFADVILNEFIGKEVIRFTAPLPSLRSLSAPISMSADLNPTEGVGVLEKKDESFVENIKENAEQASFRSSHVKIPRHMVVLDHLTKSIVVAIRGTSSVSDMITDLSMETVPFLTSNNNDGASDDAVTVHHSTLYAHEGFADSAFALLEPITRAISDARQRKCGRYKDYRVVVTGHSLGAAVSCLLSILLSHKSKISNTAFAFAPPPCVSEYEMSCSALNVDSSTAQSDAPNAKKYSKASCSPSILDRLTCEAPCQIHCFINNEDLVPRGSFKEFSRMIAALKVLDNLPWTPLQRTEMILKGELTHDRMNELHGALKSVQLNNNNSKLVETDGVTDQNHSFSGTMGSDTNAEMKSGLSPNVDPHHVEMYIPGNVYWMRSVEDEKSVDRKIESVVAADEIKGSSAEVAEVEKKPLSPSSSDNPSSNKDFFDLFNLSKNSLNQETASPDREDSETESTDNVQIDKDSNRSLFNLVWSSKSYNWDVLQGANWSDISQAISWNTSNVRSSERTFKENAQLSQEGNTKGSGKAANSQSVAVAKFFEDAFKFTSAFGLKKPQSLLPEERRLLEEQSHKKPSVSDKADITPKSNSVHLYRLHCSADLFTGYLITAPSMLADHGTEPYKAALLRIEKN